jgi:hypothetical protein
MDLFNQSSATFSQCRKYRYVLSRVWDASKLRIAFVGLNPSTANESTNDPTITHVINFANSFGYGGLYMLNLFAYVTPYPSELKQCEDPIKDNDEYLIHYSSLVDKIVFCWGNFDVFGRDLKVASMFPKAYCLGLNASGSPRHPLYLKSDTHLIPFRAKAQNSGKCKAVNEPINISRYGLKSNVG